MVDSANLAMEPSTGLFLRKHNFFAVSNFLQHLPCQKVLILERISSSRGISNCQSEIDINVTGERVVSLFSFLYYNYAVLLAKLPGYVPIST